MTTPIQLVFTRIPDSWRWIWPDLRSRLLFFAAVCTPVALICRPAWLGVSLGRFDVQLKVGLIAALVMFLAAMFLQLPLSRLRGRLSVPAGADDASFQAAYYLVNGTLEEAFFRGMVQGGLGALIAAQGGGLGVRIGVPVGLFVGTSSYVLYHKFAWPWADTLATALVGVPAGLLFWLLPGPPSLLGVSIAHVAATCGFLGPGPYLLHKLKLI